MKLLKLTTVLIFIISFCFAKANDTTQYETRLQKLENTIENIAKQNQGLAFVNDSLNKELLLKKIEQKYFITQLSNQTGIFSLIILVILSLAGLIAYNQFYIKLLKKIQKIDTKSTKSIRKLDIRLENFSESLGHHINSVLTQINFSYSSLANLFQDKHPDYNTRLFATRLLNLIQMLANNDHYNLKIEVVGITDLLEEILSDINENIKEDESVKLINELIPKLQKDLTKLFGFCNEEQKKQCIEILSWINKKLPTE